MALDSEEQLSESTKRPVSPCNTTSGVPPVLHAMTGLKISLPQDKLVQKTRISKEQRKYRIFHRKYLDYFCFDIREN